MICKNCKEDVSFFTFILGNGLCLTCKDKEEMRRLKEEKEQERIKEAIEFLESCGITVDDEGRTIFNPTTGIFSQDNGSAFAERFNNHYRLLPKVAKDIGNRFLLGKSFDELITQVNSKNFDKNNFLDKLFESAQLMMEKNKIKERTRKHQIKMQAEREVFGKEKNKRNFFSEDDKATILAHFNNECTICGATEGLQIHHKDKNPSNNQMNNLLVLCGVCHKKVHMNVR